MLDTLPSIQELLKMAIPSSDYAKFPLNKICHKTNYILPGRVDDLFHMQLRNKGINLFVQLAFLMHKENLNLRLCIGNQAIKIFVSSRVAIPSLEYNLGMFCTSLIYFKTNWRCPFHLVNNEQREPQIDWKKGHLMGDAVNYPGIIMHANDIIAKDHNITFIHDLTTLADIHQD